MDQSHPVKPSGIPRPSRLPVPRAGLRASASNDNLQPLRPEVPNPRLRNAPSRDQLDLPTSSRRTPSLLRTRGSSQQLRERDVSTGTVIYSPIKESDPRIGGGRALSKRPSQVFAHKAQPERYGSPNDGVQEAGRRDSDAAGFQETQRKSIPSLSERAMDTLQHIPSSPAVRKRTSSFFNPESPMRPTSSGTQSSRPGSGHQNDISMMPPNRSASSRPTSSAGPTQSVPIDFRASTNTFGPPRAPLAIHTPGKRPSIPNLRTPSSRRQNMGPTPASTSKLPSPRLGTSARQRSLSPVQLAMKPPPIKAGSQTVSARSVKPRSSVSGLFRKPSMPTLDQSDGLDRIGFGSKKRTTTASNTSSEASKSTTVTSISGDDQVTTSRKSSLAFRDQIAKAKAAKRAAAAKEEPEVELGQDTEVPVVPTATFDFGLSDDPFGQQIHQGGAKGLLKKRIAAARSEGRLNIAAMGLKDIPDEVLRMYDLESITAHDGSWAESVDLTRFVAAGNEIELIHDDVFPDVDSRDFQDNEEHKGNQFGALETLDIHGNLLIAIPLGLRRLDLLTTLNLANNKLNNDCFEVISQIPSLRDLKLGNNNLVGPLDSRIAALTSLEVLDVQHNTLASLPDGLTDLVRLRVLNLTNNRLTALPFGRLQHLPLIELFAAKNNLAGTLIGSDIKKLSKLQVLDVTGNALTDLTLSESLNLPSLHQLSLSSNRITSLPDVTSWISLRNLIAEDNNIDSIPEGFTTLLSLKNVDFSGNNIRILDDRIGTMDNLDIFRISGNPLREKKFSSMTTEDLKNTLKARVEPEKVETLKEIEPDGAFYSASTSPLSPNRPSSSDWPVHSGGVLDRSNTKAYSLNPVAAAHVAANNIVKALELHHNIFKEIPNSIAFFAATLTSLNLAHNDLSSDTFIKDDLELPVLKELNLSSNTFNSVQPLIQKLQAPNLEKLDISFNRLSSLPPLKPHFPSLITLLASNNTIKELSPEAAKGLAVLDCSSNEINSLNARLGLLGGPGGLQRLDVSGNRFRVPKYTILEKGTEATLAWLRDRIPAGEAASGDAIADLD